MRSCRRFLAGIPHLKVDPHVLLTRPPLPCLRKDVRLACVRHAASVYPEPGSNSPSDVCCSSSPRRRRKCISDAIKASYINYGCSCSQIMVVDRILVGTRDAIEIDRNECVVATAFQLICSAFHSSVVKVRTPEGACPSCEFVIAVRDRCDDTFASVAVVSQIRSALSRPLPVNFGRIARLDGRRVTGTGRCVCGRGQGHRRSGVRGMSVVRQPA
jgi:hypothetical protein